MDLYISFFTVNLVKEVNVNILLVYLFERLVEKIEHIEIKSHEILRISWLNLTN